jgi:hypothetical protein
VDKTLAAVHERLVKEINFWSDRYIKLQDDIAAGKDVRLTLENVRRTIDDLTARRESREKELLAMRHVVSATPVVLGGALVIPAGLLMQRKGEPGMDADADAEARVEQIAMQAVMDAERALGTRSSTCPRRSAAGTSPACPRPSTASLPPSRHIEVKGRAKGQTTITVTRNEILYGLNQADKFILAIVLVDGDSTKGRSTCAALHPGAGLGRDQHQSRFDALSGALQPDARFKAAFEWFTAMEDVERREREARRSFEYRLPALEVVRGAISRMIDDCSNPRTVIRPLRFLIDRCAPDGTVRSLRVTQLSDGYRVVLGLVMDLARRMAQANSELVPGGNEIVNPLDLPAVVLIDEVDLHLHPRWQQRIVGDLMRTFPGAQFIVTTHSPQVLSSVPASSIRVLQSTTDPESGSQVFRADVIEEQTQGVASNDVLSRIMGVDPVPDVLQARQLSEFRAMIQREQDRTEAGQALRAQLVEHFGPSHPEISELDRLVRLATFKRTLPKRG